MSFSKNAKEILSSAAIYSILSSIILGGLTSIFKQWIISEEKFNDRIKLLKQCLFQKLSEYHYKIFSTFSEETKIDRIILLRDDVIPNEKTSIIGQYSAESYRTFTIIGKLENLYQKIKVYFNVLLYSVIIAIICLFLFVIFPKIRVYTAVVSILVVALQIILMVKIRKRNNELDNYEKQYG